MREMERKTHAHIHQRTSACAHSLSHTDVPKKAGRGISGPRMTGNEIAEKLRRFMMLPRKRKQPVNGSINKIFHAHT